MASKGYIKGNTFENLVKNRLAVNGYFVVRQGRSAFPDLLAVNADKRILLIECKTNKHISNDERIRFKALEKYGELLIAYKHICDNRIMVTFCDLDYVDQFNLSGVYTSDLPSRAWFRDY